MKNPIFLFLCLAVYSPRFLPTYTMHDKSGEMTPKALSSHRPTGWSNADAFMLIYHRDTTNKIKPISWVVPDFVFPVAKFSKNDFIGIAFLYVLLLVCRVVLLTFVTGDEKIMNVCVTKQS